LLLVAFIKERREKLDSPHGLLPDVSNVIRHHIHTHLILFFQQSKYLSDAGTATATVLLPPHRWW
jgi:hypothetical protein